MSNKRFDHQIKNKLESVHPPYTPAAWQNFQQLLPVPWHVVFLKKYGSWVYGGAATIAVITLLFFYSQEREQTASLQKEIIALQKEHSRLDSLQAQSGITQSNSIQNERTAPDTLYVIKKVFIKKESGDKIVYSTHGKALRDSDHHYLAPNRILLSQEQGYDSAFYRTNKRKSLNNASLLNIKNSKTDSISRLAFSQLDTDSTLTIGLSLSSLDSAKALLQDSLGNSLVEKPIKQDSAQASKATLPPTRFGFNAGITGKQEISYGPSLEYFIGKQISVEAGIQFSRGFNGDYDSLYRFSHKKPGVDSTSFIRYDSLVSFDQSTKIVRLPLHLNYYWPVNKKVSFILTAGTNLHLSVSQKMSLNNRHTGEVVDQFERTASPVIFQNVFFGAGLEYKLRNLAFQIAPYYRHPFKTPAYEPNPAKTGVNAVLKINLSR